MNETGRLFILSAPSGAGKTSLAQALVEQESDVVASISHTTRPMRAGEVDGKNYFFITTEAFNEMIRRDDFLEYAKVFGNFYGTSRLSVQSLLNQGLKVILEIDWQGAAQVRRCVKNSVSIFILPPSRAELENRLRNRGQDSDEVIAERMRDAKSEISHYREFDHVILNGDFDNALRELTMLFHDPEGYRSLDEEKLQSLTTELLSQDCFK